MTEPHTLPDRLKPLTVVVASAPMMPPRMFEVACGHSSLAEIVAQGIALDAISRRFWQHGHVTVDGFKVPREWWRHVRAKPGRQVFLWIPPMDPLSIGSAIGLALFQAGASVAFTNAVVFGVANFGLAALGIVGNLAVNALFTPPGAAITAQGDDIAQANRASIQQNIPRKGQPYPFVFGTARVAPQPLCYARSYLDGDDDVAEAVLALAGPHSMSDVRVKGVPVADDDDIDVWIDDGTAAARTNQFDAYAYTEQIGAKLERHAIHMGESSSGFQDRELLDQATPANSLPGWRRVKSRRNADHFEIGLAIRNPFDAGAGIVNQAIWFRLRARKVGESTWKNIGTLPYIGKGQGDFRRRIRFHFKRYPGGVAQSPKPENGFLLPPATLPAVTVDHAVIKIADGERFPPAYEFMHRRQREGIDIYPDDDAGETYFTAGVEYEFEIQRSEMMEETDLLVVPTMEISTGVFWDLFDARLNSGVWKTQENTDDQGEEVYIDKVSSVFESPPVPEGAAISTLHIRTRNKELSEITCMASALVPTWNGSAFTGQSASSNPADHYRNILAGDENVDPLTSAHLDDETLGEWRDECAAQGYEVNLAYYGNVGEALRLVASCGYARPLEGVKYGVAYYRDTSAERPVQMFTPRNIRDYSWSVPFSKRPGALLCKFNDAANDFEPNEIIVDDPFEVAGATGEIEEAEFPGFTTEAQVTARAQFDFDQARRNVRHRFACGFEWLTAETRPGNVALLSTDDLGAQAAWGRVSSVTDGTNFVVDSGIGFVAPTSFFDVTNVFDLENVFATGAEWGVAVRSAATGQVRIMSVSAFDAGTLTATVGSTGDIAAGDLCAFGPLEQVTRRVLILEVTPQGDDMAEIVCADEGNDPASYFNFLADESNGLLADAAGDKIEASSKW